MADATNGGLGARAAGATGTGTADSSSSSNDLRERPIGELVKDLSSQTSTLVRKEIELARAELQQKGKVAGKGAGMLAGAAVAGPLALGAITAALIALLDKAMATWVAALIVMALWAIVALVLAKSGQKALQSATPPAPQTVETVKEDIQWAKNPTGSAPR
jgi:MFS family permease